LGYYGPHSTPMLLSYYLALYRRMLGSNASDNALQGSYFLFPAWDQPLDAALDGSLMLSHQQLREALSQLFPAERTSHSGYSFRAGGATDLDSKAVPLEVIKKKGRWRSDAVRLYIKHNHRASQASINSVWAFLSQTQDSAPPSPSVRARSGGSQPATSTAHSPR
jgi:hypothetical protein